MRQTILGAVVVVLGLLLPLILGKVISTAPDWVWRLLSFAVITLGMAVVLFSGPVYVRLRAPLNYPVSSTLIIALTAALLASSMWWFFVVKQTRPHLEFFATTTTADYPLGTTIAGIPWRSPYVVMQLEIRNPTHHTYEDLDFLLRPDKLVAAISQESSIENVWFEVEYVSTVQMELHRQTGQRFAIPLVLIATDGGYHVRCSRLPAKTRLRIVMATVTMAGTGDEPEKNVFSKSYRLRFGITDKKSGRQSSVWFGYEDRPDSVHGAKSLPTTLTVDGNYIAAQQTQTVSERIEVRDLLGEAVKQIRSRK